MKLGSQNSGYTLVELLIVVAIVSVMSAVAFSNYGTSRKNAVLRQEAQKIILDLRRAQNMAMNVVKFNNEVPTGGYGIKIGISSPGEYLVYADCDNNHEYDGDGVLSCANGTETEKISDRNRVLSAGINISAVSFNNIVFQPPYPIIWIDGNVNVVSSTITLRYGGAGGPTKDITINGITGQITGN